MFLLTKYLSLASCKFFSRLIQKLPELECFSISVLFIILQIFIANNVSASYFVNCLLTSDSFEVGDSLRNCFKQI